MGMNGWSLCKARQARNNTILAVTYEIYRE
jgi:hypothetical protein